MKNMEKTKLIELVKKSQNGDKTALNSLINEIYNDLYYYVLKTVKDENLASDVTQESCIEIITTINNLQNPEAFTVWSRRIAFHQCTRYFRKNHEILVEENEDGETIFDKLEDEGEDALPEKVLEDDEFRKTIMDMINSLSSEQSNALLLYYYEKLSVKQIAEIQDTTEGTVKSRLNYARKAIKGKVEEYEERTGTKLHSIAILPFLMRFIFGTEKNSMPALSVPTAVTATVGATGIGVAVGATAGTAGATAAAKGIGAGLAAKIVAGVLAVSVVIGGSAFGISKLSSDKDENKDASKDRDNGEYVTDNSDFVDPDAFEYEFINDEELQAEGYVITGSSFEGENLVIPSEYNGKPVIGIRDNVFSNSNVTQLALPDSIKYIEAKAFYECGALKKVVIPDDCCVFSEAFSNCDSIEEVIIGKNCSLDDGAFVECNGLKKVTIGDNCKLMRYCFSGCELLSEVIFPDAYFSLEYGCFKDCPSLKFVDLDFIVFDEETFVVDKDRNVIDPHCELSEKAFDKNIVFNSMYIDWDEEDVDFGKTIVTFNTVFCNSYKTVFIPEVIKELGVGSFENATCDIQFMGTIAQWNEIEWELENNICYKNEKNFPITVNCTDGVLNTFSYRVHRASDENGNCVDCGEKCSIINYPPYEDFEISADKTEAYLFFIGSGVEEVTVPSTYEGLPVYSVTANHTFSNPYVRSAKFEEGYKLIENLCFLRNLETVYLPSTIEKIGHNTFETSVKDIYYNGTIADWEKIELSSNWFYFASEPLIIHCTDGDIEIERD